METSRVIDFERTWDGNLAGVIFLINSQNGQCNVSKIRRSVFGISPLVPVSRNTSAQFRE